MIPGARPPESSPSGLPDPTARIVSRRLRGARRHRLQEAVRTGKLIRVAEDDVLAEAALPQLATRSVWLFVISAVVYAGVIELARQWLHASQLLGAGPLLLRIGLLVALNILGYVAMIPAHEAVHALVILALGGRPRFGLKFPLAAYCTAPNQLFPRNDYLAVALAPLIVLSGLALIIAALAPNVAAALLLAVAGNVSGAVGDLEVTRAIRQQAPDTLVADTATGYIAYRLEP